MKVELLPYPAYQPAESEWIGEIPDGWDVLPFKRICKRVDVGIAEAATHAYAEIGVPIIRGTNIRPHKIEGEILYIEPWFAEKNRSKYMWAGDLVTVRTGYPGVTAVIPPELDKSQCFTMIISTPKKGQDSRFYCYFFNSVAGMAHFEVEGWGSAQTNISVPTVQEILVPFPPADQQQAIVVFLDRETAKIDRLMAVRQKQVERLQEQRTAVIHHAVTKGIDPQAKMKPSGHPWLEEIPAHWDAYRLKFIAKLNPSKGASGYTAADAERVVFLPMECVSTAGKIDQSTRERICDLWKGFTYFAKGDVVVAKITPCFENGKGALLSELETDIGFGTTEFHVIRAGSELLRQFLYLTTASYRFRGIGERFMTGAAGQQRVSEQFIADFPIALPPLDEQQAIVAHIDRETAKIDTLIAKYQRELELLSEYRASLISHAVTGKIDVRGLVEPSPTDTP